MVKFISVSWYGTARRQVPLVNGGGSQRWQPYSTISLDFQRIALIKINQEIANPPVALLVKSPACRKRIVRTNLPGRTAAQDTRPKPLMLGNDRCGQPAVP